MTGRVMQIHQCDELIEYKTFNYYFRISLKMLDRFPPELREKIMEKVWKRSDRENLAYSCKAIYKVMKPFLWQRLELETGYFYYQLNIYKNKHFIQNLRLRFDRNDTQNLSDFLRILLDGKSTNVSYLTLEGNIPDDIFSQLMSTSTQLRILKIYICDDFQWDYPGLVLPSTLKVLEFFESTVTDTFLASIIDANLETLEDLFIGVSFNLTPKGYLPISRLIHLKRLTLYEEDELKEVDVSFVSNLKNLEYLKVQSLKIVEDSHIGIWKCVPHLKELHLIHVHGMNNFGDISPLQKLRCLDLDGTEDISTSFAENVTSLKNLRTLHFGSSLYKHYRDTDLDILCRFKDMSLLHSVRISSNSDNTSQFNRIVHKLRKQILSKWSIKINYKYWLKECILSRV